MSLHIKGDRMSIVGTRAAGPHRRVKDEWALPHNHGLPKKLDLFPKGITIGHATCRCLDCGAEWPEGGFFPEACR